MRFSVWSRGDDRAASRSKGRPPRALIVNAFSLENRGDAAIASGLIATAHAAGARYITVAPRTWRSERERWFALGANRVVPPLMGHEEQPAWLRGRFLKLAWIVWRGLIAAAFINLRQARHPAVRAYRDADVVLAVGGGYLGGPNAGINLMKAVNASAGRRAGKPVIYAGVTVTPTSRASAFILRRFMTGVVVFVRDRQSQDVLAGIGVPAKLTPDLCFRAPEVVSFLGKPPAVRETVTDGLAIAWTPRELESWHLSSEVRSRIERNCLDAVVELMRTRNATLLFVAQATVPGRYDDRIAISRLQEQLPADVLPRVKVAPVPESITQAMEAYAGVDVVLSSRLHATLLALACGTPSLAIGYDPKIAGVLTELGLQDRVVTADPNWTSQRIQESLVSLLDPQQRALTYAARERARNGYNSLDRSISEALKAPPTAS